MEYIFPYEIWQEILNFTCILSKIKIKRICKYLYNNILINKFYDFRFKAEKIYDRGQILFFLDPMLNYEYGVGNIRINDPNKYYFKLEINLNILDENNNNNNIQLIKDKFKLTDEVPLIYLCENKIIGCNNRQLISITTNITTRDNDNNLELYYDVYEL